MKMMSKSQRNFRIGRASPIGKCYRVSSISAVLLSALGGTSALANNAAWNTNAADGNFNEPNWSINTTPTASGSYTVASGDSLYFGTSTTTTLTNNLTNATYNGITFNSGASAFTIGGNAFTLGGNIMNSSASLQTINNNMTVANRTFSGGTGGLALGGTMSASGSLTVNSGSISLNGATTIDGSNGSNNGYLTVAGNTSVTINSNGSLEIKGTTNGTKPNSIVGQNATGTSTLQVNGGTLTVDGNTGFDLGNNSSTATGVLTISSGTATITAGSAIVQNQLNYIALGRDNATGIINLDGGTLATSRQFLRDGSGGGTVGAGTATFNFNGGTLQALANQTSGNGWFETATTGNFQVVTTTVQAGGATIDTNGYTTNINTVLAHDSTLGATPDGGLTKKGLGTLQLGGANTYTGGTTVSAGTLIAADTSNTAGQSSTGTGNVTLNGGTLASLAGTTSYISGSVNAGSGTHSIAPGGVGTFGQLNVGGLSLNANSTLSFDINGSSQDLLDDSGTLTVTGTPTVSLTASGLSASSYTLANYTASGLSNSSFNFLSTPSGYHWNVTDSALQLLQNPTHSAVALLTNTNPSGSYSAMTGTANPGGATGSSTITVSGHNGSYTPGYLNDITTNGNKGYVTIAGFTPADAVIGALSLTVGGAAPTSAQLSQLISDLNAGATGLTAELFSDLQSSNPDAYNALKNNDPNYGTDPLEIAFVNSGTYSSANPTYLALDFSNENSSLGGSVLVTDIAAIPEPAAAALVGLVSAVTLLRRRRRK